MKFATFYQPLWSLSWLLCMCRLLLSTVSRLVYFPVLLYIITAYSVNEHLSCLVRLAYFTFEILCKTLLPLLVKKSITDWFSPLTLQTSLFKEFILRNVDSAQSILLSLFFQFDQIYWLLTRLPRNHLRRREITSTLPVTWPSKLPSSTTIIHSNAWKW